MVDELETNELELMEKADELKASHSKAMEALALTQKEVNKDIADLDEKANQNKERLQELQSERAELVKAVDGSLLALYDRLLKSKGDDPVAPLKGSQCGGCHMKVTASTVVAVQSEKSVAQCENCGRILYC
ncbi:zinc ribbon domain-containing protein [Rubritalea tangerina]